MGIGYSVEVENFLIDEAVKFYTDSKKNQKTYNHLQDEDDLYTCAKDGFQHAVMLYEMAHPELIEEDDGSGEMWYDLYLDLEDVQLIMDKLKKAKANVKKD